MKQVTRTVLVGPLLLIVGCGAPTMNPSTETSNVSDTTTQAEVVAVSDQEVAAIEGALLEKHGHAQAERIRRGLAQVRERWRPSDGGADELQAFAEEHFLTEEAALQDTARHLEYALEMIDGHMHEIDREASRYQDLSLGPMRPVDSLLAAYSPAAHANEDLFKTRVAFVGLLNFPVTTLEQRIGEGKTWSRDQWALARLTNRFEFRVPAEVNQEIARVSSNADRYIDGYNIHMGRLVTEEGSNHFATDLKLISHWGLRDELRALYAKEDGLGKQRLIATIMKRIVRQEIPADVIDSGELLWNPTTNRVRHPDSSEWREVEREGDVRYQHLLSVFRARRAADPFFPSLPSHIERSFSLEREIPEARMRKLLESVLLSETAGRVGAAIRARLGRPLEPFDIWYDGFRPGGAADEAELDRITRDRYPTAEAFQEDIPRILEQLGFSTERARFLADHIVVEPARGAGHAAGAQRREDNAHLRTRVGPNGMDYKGFNIAVHELGHNVEQVFSMSMIDHTLLEGVPNTGFTEAFAFLFQTRDLEILGQSPPEGDARARADSLRALDRFWTTFEIAGVAILDIEIWHWMYEHPESSASELREAMVELSQQVWNRYYAPVFGVRDSVLLAIYSHIIAYGLYTPDYPVGFLITGQVERYVRERELATEMERMCRLGQLAPDVWMEQAVGDDVSSDAVIEAAETALASLEQ